MFFADIVTKDRLPELRSLLSLHEALKVGSAARREDASRKRGGGGVLCNAGTCLHVPSEFMLAEEDTLPLRLLLGSATLY